MALKGILVTAATCLLVSMEVVLSLHSLSSSWKHHQRCGGGNLMKINTNNCATVAGRKQCEVKVAGTTFFDNGTRFKIKEPDRNNKPGLFCIQFTDVLATNKKYALRAINGSSLAFEEGGCHGNIGSDFLFEEQAIATADYMTKIYRPSKYTAKCLTGGCDGRLSVISVNNTENRKCYFRKIPV